ncbi:MAG: dTMP kinase [Erythrobacter sp.]
MSGAPRKGRFIAFEGGEGTGKSTQARRLADALGRRGLDVAVSREPGGTPGAEAIRALLLDPPGEGWGSRAEALLFAAARADHVATLVRPSLEAGRWVVCDRFVDSSRAYQGGAGGLGDRAIVDLHAFGSESLRPDLTILLELDQQAQRDRLAARDGDRFDAIGGRGADYHAEVSRTFARLAHEAPAEWAVVDAHGSEQQVHDRVLAAIAPLLEEVEA